MPPRIGLIAYGFDFESSKGFEEAQSCDPDAISLQDAILDLARSCEGIIVAHREVEPHSLPNLYTRETAHGGIAGGALVVSVPADEVESVLESMPVWVEAAGIS